MNATKHQKQLIHINAPTRDIKEEFVQWATDDNDKTSCNDLSFDQANEILKKLGKPTSPLRGDRGGLWGRFKKDEPKHRYILSLLRQLGWTKSSERYGTIADIERFGKFLQSERSPVQKPLMKMTSPEVSKTISALESMLGKKFAK